MNQQDVDASLASSARLAGLDRCSAAAMVNEFLSGLIAKAGFLERQALRMVRGYVVRWVEKNCAA